MCEDVVLHTSVCVEGEKNIMCNETITNSQHHGLCDLVIGYSNNMDWVLIHWRVLTNVI